jgi:hypothetical protein
MEIRSSRVLGAVPGDPGAGLVLVAMDNVVLKERQLSGLGDACMISIFAAPALHWFTVAFNK